MVESEKPEEEFHMEEIPSVSEKTWDQSTAPEGRASQAE